MDMTRRSWLKRAASGALGLGAAKAGFEKLIPAVVSPDNTIPGVSTWFATTCRECPAGCGMLVRVRENRPVKCEGNPLHPISQGRLCARGQAAIQALYDPDRVAGPMVRDDSGHWQPAAWEDALGSVGAALSAAMGAGRVAFVSGLETGALAELVDVFLMVLGSERYLRYEPIGLQDLARAHDLVLGQRHVPAVRLTNCDYVLSFGADFLDTWLSPVRLSAEYGSARAANPEFRLAYVGPRLSCTAAAADQRFLVRPGAEAEVALAVLHEVASGVDPTIVEPVASGGALKRASRAETLRGLTRDFAPDAVAVRTGLPAEAIQAMADRFRSARRPVALATDGDAAIAAVLLNAVTAPGAVNGEPLPAHALGLAASPSEMAQLVDDMGSGLIEVLIVHGANPAHALPPGLGFVDAVARVPMVVSLSTMRDETAELAKMILPTHSPLESWGDYEPEAGTACVSQPTMAPLFDTRMVGDVLLDLAVAAGVDLRARSSCGSFYDCLRRYWRRSHLRADDDEAFEAAWWEAVSKGFVTTAAADHVSAGPTSASLGAVLASAEGHGDRLPFVRPAGLAPGVGRVHFSPDEGAEGLRLHAPPSILLYDGRGANLPWLQELPDPMTKTVWGSVVELHPDTARQYRISTGEVVTVKRGDAVLEAPAYVWDGVAPGTVVVQLGQGHVALGDTAKGVGANAFTLLPSEVDGPLTVEISTEWVRRMPVGPQGDDRQHSRRIVQTIRAVEVGEARLIERELTLPLPEGYHSEHDMYPGHEHRLHRWAMVVDLDRCTGCNACVVACFAENNIATVGPDQVSRGREMAWLRIDRYFEDSPDTPVLFLPMLCQQCDSAPCEPVCPVYAAVHSEDGINTQVYNRCVGTRYCSNNCPFKVRRFNWFDYEWPEPLNRQLNPDVTVRGRGVMEKCTFCVQRIREAGHIARREGRTVRDGDVKPACVQTCPTGAMVFGDLLDDGSRVSQLIRKDPRAYQVLHELNTKPAVIYLKRIVRQV